MEIKRVLIRTPNWLGDSVMSIPTVIGVKKLFPDSEVSVWTKPGLMDLWRLLPLVDNVIDSPSPCRGTHAEAWVVLGSVPKKHNFDLGILLTNSFGSALRMYLAGVPERRGYNINGRGFLLTQPVPLRGGLHQIEYFMGVVDGLEADSTPRIDIPMELRNEAKRFLTGYGWDGDPNIIGIHATASYGPAKCWLKERFSQLIDNFNAWVLVIGSNEEKEDIEDILINVHNHRRIINLAGQTDIKMLSGVMGICRVFIANDSGPMHLAASLGVPVAAIFGSTDPDRTGPRGRCIVVKKDVPCSPCFKRICPKDLECMKMIEVKDVMDAVDKLMSEAMPWALDVRGSASNIKIAVVMKDYDEQRGGAERYLVNLVPRLAKELGSVDLIVNRINGNPPAGVNVKNVKAIRWSSTLEPLSFNWSVQRLLRKNRYDVVYGLTQIYPQDVYRVGGGLGHSWFDIRYKKIWQRLVNYIRPRNMVRLYMENRIFTKGNYKKIITNSNLCKYQILHHYRVSPENIAVVYNGVDKSRFNPDVKVLYRDKARRELGIGPGDKVTLFISNNWKRKGLVELIKAVKQDTWLIVVGRGGKGPYMRLAKRSGIEDKIRFVGPTAEPEKYYGASDVFVLPTYYDPFANVCIEALSCGLPVVTTRLNGAAEFIVDGRNGYIINDPNDIKGLADCIEKAFSLQGDVKDITIESNAQQTLDVLKNVDRGAPPEVGAILINNGYRGLLEKKGWLSFDNVMGETGGVLYKKNNLRSVVRIENVFLKRHFSPQRASSLRLRHGAGFREWQNIFRLRSLGIPTMNPVAVGERGEGSFIITESLESTQRLEDFIKSSRLSLIEKMGLIYELASLTKKMHRNNIFHKDFYSGHIFVSPVRDFVSNGVRREDAKFRLYLIDLQRLCRHWLFKTRWCIKDLASLNFSSIGGFINNTDRMRFLKYYLDGYNKRFVKKILAKTDRIARHTEKILARRAGL